jgi:hypothetical protein
MSGLRFESMADMPPRMRELYARQKLDLSGAAAPAPLAKGSRGNAKYHNERAERAGIRFDSQKEARRYDELMVMLRAGIIYDLRLQPQFTLQESYITETGERIRAVRYTADFSYKFGGKLVVEDVKSAPTRTKEYLRNRKFMRSKFGIDIQEIKKCRKKKRMPDGNAVRPAEKRERLHEPHDGLLLEMRLESG